jgi:hypothetical protein
MKSKEEILDTKLCNRDYKSSPDLREPTESPGSLNDSDLPSSTTCTPEDSDDNLPDKPIKIKPWSNLERRLDHGLVSFIIKCVHLPLNQFLVMSKEVGLI